MQRRRFLAATLALPFVPRTWALAATEIPAEGPLSAVVKLQDATLTFSEEKGEDLGVYNGFNFVQRCIRSTLPDVPMTVFFRPDANSNRAEVVFELGRLYGPMNRDASDWGPYRASIYRGKTLLAEIDAPGHWWCSTWRWQSEPRPVIRTVAELTKRGLLLPYDKDSAFGAQTQRLAQYKGPMDNCGISLDMGGAGERGDIGPMTDWQTYWVLTQDPDYLACLLGQGEVGGTVPWNMRDEVTGAPIDFYAHPDASWGNVTDFSLPAYIYTPLWKSPKRLNQWQPDGAHQPALAYLPYMLTDDPYFLEKMQFQMNWHIGEQLGFRRRFHVPVLVYGAQVRAVAWGLRTLGQLSIITPEKTPRWLLPRAHWKQILEDHRKWFETNYTDSPSPAATLFHCAVRWDLIDAWMEAYLSTAIGWLVLMGHEEWRRTYEWKIKYHIAMTNGKTGWNRQFPAPYEMRLGVHREDENPNVYFSSWGEAWEDLCKQVQSQFDKKGKGEKFPPVPAPPEPTFLGMAYPTAAVYYLMQVRGALAVATHHNIPESVACCKFMDAMIRDCIEKRPTIDGRMYRWAITPKYS